MRAIRVTCLADGLAHNQSLEMLEMTHCEIGHEGCQAIAMALRTNSTLERLDLSFNLVDDVRALALSEGLRANTALNRLTFSLMKPLNRYISHTLIPHQSNNGVTRHGYQTITNAGVSALGLAIRDARRARGFTLENLFLCEAWQELGLTEAAKGWSNDDVIVELIEQKRRMDLLLAFGMAFSPRLAGASPFKLLHSDMFKLIVSATLAHTHWNSVTHDRQG